VTDLLLAGILVVLLLDKILLWWIVEQGVKRLHAALQAEVAPRWTTLPPGIAPPGLKPHCDHNAPVYAVHASGATACQACATKGDPT
jgi:hypothetical protein